MPRLLTNSTAARSTACRAHGRRRNSGARVPSDRQLIILLLVSTLISFGASIGALSLVAAHRRALRAAAAELSSPRAIAFFSLKCRADTVPI
jgi:hypothetical protein